MIINLSKENIDKGKLFSKCNVSVSERNLKAIKIATDILNEVSDVDEDTEYIRGIYNCNSYYQNIIGIIFLIKKYLNIINKKEEFPFQFEESTEDILILSNKQQLIPFLFNNTNNDIVMLNNHIISNETYDNLINHIRSRCINSPHQLNSEILYYCKVIQTLSDLETEYYIGKICLEIFNSAETCDDFQEFITKVFGGI